MIRISLCVALLGLAGCASHGTVRGDHAGFFDAPTASDLAAERERCFRSAFCRNVLGQMPPVLFTGLNDKRVPLEHAYEAERRLEGVAGVQRMQVVTGARASLRGPSPHAVLLVTYEGHDYVIDADASGRPDGGAATSCRSPAECAGSWESRRPRSPCPDGVCDAQDGLHDLIVSGAPIPMWPKQDYIAAKSDPGR